MNNLELTRHEIREKALQALFPLDFNAELSKQDAIYYTLELDQREWVSEDEESFVPLYLDMLVEGVCVKKEELDTYIQKYLKGWSLTRIAKIDLVIMRIALFEMLYVEEVPSKVAVNEAIELTKKFSDDTSRKFVNGVLSNAMKEIDSKDA
ncbi:transcription antitermination factor NusB [Vagococcus entomophilus]|uniref:Transcription antitermination protein NusB n=1 Tax=Vagococcus entomophilus TaxID=1160095 RepID=A0A430AII2_9ENTE|nr:transcription antitermination factor NusB [Vagococcus entomophilus]RSU07813.1 N utilization substance protein B [Vagococcus entomophilus]